MGHNRNQRMESSGTERGIIGGQEIEVRLKGVVDRVTV